MKPYKEVELYIPNSIVRLTNWGYRFELNICDRDISDILNEPLKEIYQINQGDTKTLVGELNVVLKLFDPNEQQIHIRAAGGLENGK